MDILGIDLGHCETAVAAPRGNLEGHKVARLCPQQKESIIVTQIVLTNAQMRLLKGNKVPSCSLLSKLGEIDIGNFLPKNVEDGEKFIYFKVPPKDFDTVCAKTEVGKECGITHGMVMACYAYALVNSVFKYNYGAWDGKDINQTELLVGCPATTDWTSDKAKEMYARLIKNATGVKSVEIIPESRAAMFSSIETGKNRVSAVNGAMVFDFGSSTADCTYMLLGRKIFEFSWTLGASEIERMITKIAFDEARIVYELKTKKKFIPDISSFVRNEDDLRTAKEEFYNGIYGNEDHDMVCSFKTADKITVKQQVTINKEFMERVVGKEKIDIKCDSTISKSGTWKSLCKEFFIAAKDKLKDLPVETIVLTGGASKMDFIADLCRDVFPNTKRLRETNPSHTVANGLGWVAMADQKVADCIAEAKDEINNADSWGMSKLDYLIKYGYAPSVTKNDSLAIGILKGNMCDAVYKLVYDVIAKEVTAWGDMAGEHSARELLNSIENIKESEDFKKSLNFTIRKEIDEWKKMLSNAVAKAVNTQVEKLYSSEISGAFILPKDIWEEFNMENYDNNSINIGDALGNIDITELADEIAKITLRVIIWGLAIALAIQTFGLAIIIAALADAFLDDIFETNRLLKNEADKKRTQNKRKSIKGDILKKLSESETKNKMLSNINAELDEYSKKYESVIDDTLTRAFEIVTLKRFDAR